MKNSTYSKSTSQRAIF